MNVCGSLFSGDGLLDYGLALAGWEHAFFCESEPDRRAILSMRWPGVPIYEDVRSVDGGAPRVDLLAGGFPCKGASVTGDGTGLDHPETALWREMARIVGVLRPRFVLIENVANLLVVARSKGEPPGTAWGEVSGDLASLGYVCAWDCLPAAAFGAPHFRDRVYAVAADSAWDAEGEASAPAGTNGQRARASDHAASDTTGQGGQGTRPGRTPSGRATRNGHPLADADRERRQQESRSAPGDEGPHEWAAEHDYPTAVAWGEYEPAIRRWEAVQGPAPAPLFRGVDARDARWVVRSRLSALGDGVQVQAGHFLGAKLMELNRELQAVQKAA